MVRERIQEVIPSGGDRLDPVGGGQVHPSPIGAWQAAVGHLAHEHVAE